MLCSIFLKCNVLLKLREKLGNLNAVTLLRPLDQNLVMMTSWLAFWKRKRVNLQTSTTDGIALVWLQHRHHQNVTLTHGEIWAVNRTVWAWQEHKRNKGNHPMGPVKNPQASSIGQFVFEIASRSGAQSCGFVTRRFFKSLCYAGAFGWLGCALDIIHNVHSKFAEPLSKFSRRMIFVAFCGNMWQRWLEHVWRFWACPDNLGHGLRMLYSPSACEHIRAWFHVRALFGSVAPGLVPGSCVAPLGIAWASQSCSKEGLRGALKSIAFEKSKPCRGTFLVYKALVTSASQGVDYRWKMHLYCWFWA